MADAEYLVDQADATADIIADGNEATLFVANPATTPAWDPAYSAETGTTIYLLELEREEGFEEGTFYEWVKTMIAVKPTNLNIQTGDQIEIDGVRFTLGKVKPFRIGGIVIFWEATGNRG